MSTDAEGFYEIALKRDRRDTYYNFLSIPLEVGETVVVEAPSDEELGRVVGRGEIVSRKAAGRPTLGILRRADPGDLARFGERRQREEYALSVFKDRIEARSLEMKPVDVDWQSDGKLIRFFFTADGRIDFRELVRDLAAVYHTRIELRQIGPREEARKLGGFGICGRPFCCGSFVQDFYNIPSHAARDQNLSSSSAKLAGVCGRLKCCLRYEHAFYQEAGRKFPKVGARFRCEGGGCCSVIKNDIFRNRVQVSYTDGDVADVDLVQIDQLEPIPPP